MLELWRENCKLIWKLQTDRKIAKSYENCKHPGRNYTTRRENCNMIWKLQTDMEIANWYENCKSILAFWCIVPTWTFAIFMRDTAGMKTCSQTERMFQFDCGVDDKNSTKWSLAKPSTIHKYFNTNSYEDTVWLMFLVMIPLLSREGKSRCCSFTKKEIMRLKKDLQMKDCGACY